MLVWQDLRMKAVLLLWCISWPCAPSLMEKPLNRKAVTPWAGSWAHAEPLGCCNTSCSHSAAHGNPHVDGLAWPRGRIVRELKNLIGIVNADLRQQSWTKWVYHNKINPLMNQGKGYNITAVFHSEIVVGTIFFWVPTMVNSVL